MIYIEIAVAAIAILVTVLPAAGKFRATESWG